MSHATQFAPSHQDFVHATLNSAIFSLFLNRGSVPPTPANSPRSTTKFPHSPNSLHNPQTSPPRNTNMVSNPPTSMPSNQEGQNNSIMHWTGVNEVGSFMINGELREVTESSSAIESDSEIVVMFNLDRLNEDWPVWLRGAAWECGQIPKSTKGLIDTLVSKVDRDGLRVEVESSYNGPNSRESNVMAQVQNPIRSFTGLQVETIQAQSVSPDMGLKAIRTLEAADSKQSLSSPISARSEPRVLSCLQCDQGRGYLCGPSRKRIGSELGRSARNIRQRLICDILHKEGITYPHFIIQNCSSSCHDMYDEVSLCNPKGCWEVDLKQLPQQQ